jgi:outer membrane protein
MVVRVLAALLAWCVLAGVGAAEPLTGTVSLDECLEVALATHPDLVMADADLEAAGERVRQVRSGLLPQVSGLYAFTHQQQSVSSLIGGPTAGGGNLGACVGGTSPGTLCTSNANCPGGGICQFPTVDDNFRFNFHRSGFSATQLLFDFGQRINETRAARAEREATGARRDSTQDAVVLNVKASYYNLIAARRLLTVAEETEGQTRRQLDEARSRYEVGTAPRFDVTQQEVQVADAELARLTAVNAVALSRENLRDAMGLVEPIVFEPDDQSLDYARIGLDDETAMAQAFAHRPEMLDVQARVRAQQRTIAALKADYLPAVNGAGSYAWTGEDRPEDESWVVGANITMSIFNGGLTTARVGEGKALLHRLEGEERRVGQIVRLDVRRAILDLREAEDSIRVAEKQVEQARESLDIAEGRYSAGVGNVLEVSDAQVGLFRARANNVRKLADYWISVARLERAIGARLDA